MPGGALFQSRSKISIGLRLALWNAVMDRGSLNANGSAVVTPYWHAVLGRTEQWADLDRRGNWLDYRWAESIGGEPVVHQQTREANGVNEYPSIDPDGPLTPTPEPVPPVPLTYDAAGNLTVNPLVCNPGDVCEPGMPCGMGSPICGSGQRYVYDQENRLTVVYGANSTPEVTMDDVLLAQYEYDALGRRVSSIEYVNAETGAPLTPPKRTRHLYVGIETIEEYQITGQPPEETITLDREFLWGDPSRFPEPLAMVTQGGESGGQGGIGVPAGESVYHYLHDVLGSVVGLTDADGELAERYTYDPYGRTFIETPDGQGGWNGGRFSVFGNPFLWTGQRYDPGTGLYAFLFRTYSPSLGRWLQRDPAEYVDGVNLYQYVSSGPLRWVDLWGASPAAVGALIGGGCAVADGPLPVGDIIGASIIAGTVAYEIYLLKKAIAQAAAAAAAAEAARQCVCEGIYKDMHAVCDVGFSCNEGMSCSQINTNIAYASACLSRRNRLLVLCPNWYKTDAEKIGHIQQRNNVNAALRNCEGVWDKLNCSCRGGR